ncbi:hypothetical protein [Rickettsia rhipicephali]|uniref:hypothetical protein n=1 Tax=Rickettsia rhipicephali TaxID=33992 RepID=UPI000A43425C|nr:hypothetical protein [Rickettsia rhipicephali]
MVETIYNILSGSECWHGSELNRTAVAKKLIMSKISYGRELDILSVTTLLASFA